MLFLISLLISTLNFPVRIPEVAYIGGPSILQQSLSDDLFGIYPDEQSDIFLNPAAMYDNDKMWLDVSRPLRIMSPFLSCGKTRFGVASCFQGVGGKGSSWTWQDTGNARYLSRKQVDRFSSFLSQIQFICAREKKGGTRVGIAITPMFSPDLYSYTDSVFTKIGPDHFDTTVTTWELPWNDYGCVINMGLKASPDVKSTDFSLGLWAGTRHYRQFWPEEPQKFRYRVLGLYSFFRKGIGPVFLSLFGGIQDERSDTLAHTDTENFVGVSHVTRMGSAELITGLKLKYDSDHISSYPMEAQIAEHEVSCLGVYVPLCLRLRLLDEVELRVGATLLYEECSEEFFSGGDYDLNLGIGWQESPLHADLRMSPWGFENLDYWRINISYAP